MTTCLLKRFLPFTLTFVLGASLGGFFNLFGSRAPASGPFSRGTLRARVGGSYGCDYRRRAMAAAGESRPLVIRDRPSAVYTSEARREGFAGTVRLRVTFGSAGKVTRVERLTEQPYGLTEAAERAAWQIRFTPATENGVSVPSTRVVEYDFPSEQTEDESAPSADSRW